MKQASRTQKINIDRILAKYDGMMGSGDVLAMTQQASLALLPDSQAIFVESVEKPMQE